MSVLMYMLCFFMLIAHYGVHLPCTFVGMADLAKVMVALMIVGSEPGALSYAAVCVAQLASENRTHYYPGTPFQCRRTVV